MTQALAVSEHLSQWGHDLVGVIAGQHAERRLPGFFAHGFPVPVETLPSPGFVFRGNRGVDLTASLWRTFQLRRRYARSLAALEARIAESQPDLVISFFEPLVGLLRGIGSLQAPVLSIGHQFLLLHPGRPRISGKSLQRAGLRGFVELTGCRSARLALSFFAAPDRPERRLMVCPPLLRSRLFELCPVRGDYYLVYLLNHGYATEVVDWHRRNPAVKMHCFYDKPGAPATEQVRPNLIFHTLDAEKFLTLLAGCRAVACTAGFESVSEAAYLGKPLFMVPVAGHIEQTLNAVDASRCGFGVHSNSFDFDRLVRLSADLDLDRYRTWVAEGPAILRRAMEKAVRDERGSAPAIGNRQPKGASVAAARPG